jgi:hypothetical protein
MDAGQNWHKVAGNLEQNASGSGNGPSCRTAAIILLGNDTLYLVGTTVGLFGTSNLDGENTVWEQIGHTTFGSTIVEYITYRQSDGLLVVGTFGNGVYQTNLTSVGDVLGINTVNTPSFEFNIYPNPVTNKATLEFTLNKSSIAGVLIYDELGRIVRKMKKIEFQQGSNSIQLDVEDLKTGIYFVSLNIDGELISKQIVKQ